VRSEVQRSSSNTKETRFHKSKTFKNKFHGWQDNRNQSDRKFKPKNKSNRTYAEQTEGIDKSELDRRKAAGECQRCAWPAVRKGAHKTIDYYIWARKEIGTAPFPKAKKYQKLKIGAYDQEEESEWGIDLYTTDEGGQSESEEDNDEDFDEDMEELSEKEESVSPERNWWYEYGSDRE